MPGMRCAARRTRGHDQTMGLVEKEWQRANEIAGAKSTEALKCKRFKNAKTGCPGGVSQPRTTVVVEKVSDRKVRAAAMRRTRAAMQT